MTTTSNQGAKAPKSVKKPTTKKEKFTCKFSSVDAY